MSSAGQCRQREGGECTGGEAGGGAMVEAVEEGRFEFNFYGVLAWASSRAPVHARSLELSSVPRPEGLAVTLFGCRLFGDGHRKISELRGRFGRCTESVARRHSEGRKVFQELLMFCSREIQGTATLSFIPEKFSPIAVSYMHYLEVSNMNDDAK